MNTEEARVNFARDPMLFILQWKSNKLLLYNYIYIIFHPLFDEEILFES